MKHPFTILKPEYTSLLAAMAVRPECRKLVDEVAHKLVGFNAQYYAPVTAAIGVPAVFIGPSFEREGSSNFRLNPAQGSPLGVVSKIIPHNGPFPTWYAAAIAAYRLNGLDKVGASNWTWELICFYGESFNGFGPRDFHHQHTTYLWGGTNIQTPGKYVRDGVYDPNVMDEQLGIIPLGRRMVEIDPDLALSAVPYVAVPPISSGIATQPDLDAKWVQATLNSLGVEPPLDVDGNYGQQTATVVREFQQSWGIEVDGLAGPETIKALKDALAAKEA